MDSLETALEYSCPAGVVGFRLRDMDPSPDYDATDEIEYFFSWLPWALRGTDWTGTPAYPPV